ncbi:MAG: RNase adapter RapZ, partial [Actinomycetota bacterium]|nr:RNase adapter RapZ [Actinomycetota bacterium]
MNSNNKRPEVLILLGLSGAGRSASCNVFEDLGYYVIENLPPDLIESVVKSNDVAESNKQLVLTVDARDGVAQSDL